MKRQSADDPREKPKSRPETFIKLVPSRARAKTLPIARPDAQKRILRSGTLSCDRATTFDIYRDGSWHRPPPGRPQERGRRETLRLKSRRFRYHIRKHPREDAVSGPMTIIIRVSARSCRSMRTHTQIRKPPRDEIIATEAERSSSLRAFFHNRAKTTTC